MAMETEMIRLCARAREAGREIYRAPEKARNRALALAAGLLKEKSPEILSANRRDTVAARSAGLSGAVIDRLTLSPDRLKAMARAIREVAAQSDPVGRVDSALRRQDGLLVRKVRVPIGVILFIYESRPNVTTDAAALCVKSGNAVVLRGGKEAFHSNRVLTRLFRTALKKAGLPENAVQAVPTADRRALPVLLRQETTLDLVIPRGGEGLIRAVMKDSRIPVLKHYKGICHVYVDRRADRGMAESVVINAKIQRPGVCNAAETLLLDRAFPAVAAKRILKSLSEKGVRLKGCAASAALLPGMERAKDADFSTEYLDRVMNVRVVDGVAGAASHIARFGSGHTEAIVTRDRKRAEAFTAAVDSSSVMWNASTRLSDGSIYGLGAEIGISTDKIHARGPMGASDLTTYKWVVTGTGHLRK